jgi:CII-binding regulator of phage lambda lysogenization HflD
MTILKYSTLKFSASFEEQLKNYLRVFEKRAEKRTQSGEFVQFDPDIVGLDIRRWMENIRKKRDINKPELKKQIEQYKTHEELHKAVEQYRTADETKLESEQQSETGTQELFSLPGGYVVYEASTPQALSKLSQGSHWCVQNVSTAQDYLQKRGAFQIVYKQNEPLFAITQEEVWYFTDYELRNGQNHSPSQSTPYVLKQDFEVLNKILVRFKKPKISVSSPSRDDLAIVDNYAEIQRRVNKAVKQGDTTELKRAILNLRDFPIELPSVFPGNLNLYGTAITKLPEGLTTVGGYLDLRETAITKLPESLTTVGGYLDLRGTAITKLPEGLTTVGGSLDLYGTAITKLPEGLTTVGGNLNLYGTAITKLPESLTTVGGSLFLRETAITKLPESLTTVGGNLDLYGTAITKLPEGLTTVGGYLDLEGTAITKLPEGLTTVGGTLDLRRTAITKLPEGLTTVGGTLNLYGTAITKLPEGLTVKRGISGTNPATGKRYQEEYDEMKKRKTSSFLRKLDVE